MKTEFKAKFLQHLNQRKEDKGFTLIELLVVVIIIGILAAVALPSLLSQTAKAKQVEARNNTGAMNRAQQAYNTEKKGFATTIGELGIGIQSQTTNYQYTITNGGEDSTEANNQAKSLDSKLKSYVGLVWTELQSAGGVTETVNKAILCEAQNPSAAAITATNKTCGPNVTLGT